MTTRRRGRSGPGVPAASARGCRRTAGARRGSRRGRGRGSASARRDDLGGVAEGDLVLGELVLVVDDQTRPLRTPMTSRSRSTARSTAPSQPAAWSCRRTPHGGRRARGTSPATRARRRGRRRRARARPGRTPRRTRAGPRPSRAGRDADPVAVLVAAEQRRGNVPVRPVAPLGHLDADRISELEPHPATLTLNAWAAWCACATEATTSW